MGDISFDERQRTRNSFLSAYPRAVIVLNLHNPTPAFDPKAFGVIHSLSSPYAEGVRLHIFMTHTQRQNCLLTLIFTTLRFAIVHLSDVARDQYPIG